MAAEIFRFHLDFFLFVCGIYEILHKNAHLQLLARYFAAYARGWLVVNSIGMYCLHITGLIGV